MKKELTCFICPQGCHITVEEGSLGLIVEGNNCPRGAEFAKQEVVEPLRILTSSVRAKGLALAMISVKTDKAMPKRLIPEAMAIIKEIIISTEVEVGAVLVENILGLDGVNLIVTKGASR